MNPVIAVLLAAALFGTTGTAKAFGPEASSLSAGAARIALGGAALALVAWWSARRGHPATAAPSRNSWLLVALGAAAVLAYQPLFFLGTSRNGVAIGTIVALGSAPVLTGLLEWLVRRRFPGSVWLVATATATVGVVLLSGVTGSSSVDAMGLLGSVGAGLSYAVYTLVGKVLIDRGAGGTWAMASMFGGAAALAVPVLIFSETAWLGTGSGVLMVLWLGLGTTTVAYLLFVRGLRDLSASTVSTLTLAEPLTATVLGVTLFDERLTGSAFVGLMVLGLGLLILAVFTPRRPAAGGDVSGTALNSEASAIPSSTVSSGKGRRDELSPGLGGDAAQDRNGTTKSGQHTNAGESRVGR